MKITIKPNSWQEAREFEISHIQYNVDEDGKPIDIVIVGKEETLLELCEFAEIGCNMQPLSPWAYPWNTLPWEQEGATHEALMARLPEFKIEGHRKVYFR